MNKSNIFVIPYIAGPIPEDSIDGCACTFGCGSGYSGCADGFEPEGCGDGLSGVGVIVSTIGTIVTIIAMVPGPLTPG